MKKIHRKIFLVFAISCLLGFSSAVDGAILEVIQKESTVISDIANRTLNISFTPNNPYMKDNASLYGAITQSDVLNIEKIDGVKSVTVEKDESKNPLSGYLKIGNEASYVYLKGINEGKNELPKNITLLHGRYINSSDKGKNVIVLNNKLLSEFKSLETKELLNTGVELNGSIYQVIGIVDVKQSDEENINDMQEYSFIPKSVEKELMSRVNSASDVYNSISVSLVEDVDINSIETSIYNLLYENHMGIEGYYERDSVSYGVSKKLNGVLLILEGLSSALKLMELSFLVAYAIILYQELISKEDVSSVFFNNLKRRKSLKEDVQLSNAKNIDDKDTIEIQVKCEDVNNVIEDSASEEVVQEKHDENLDNVVDKKVKIEDEVTDVICDVCGRNMVVKYGPHGKFLACPGFPECRNTKPYLEKIGVACQKCGKEVVLRKTKKGRKYFGCEDNPECDFMSWSRPVAEKCPKCGGYMVVKGNKIVCADEQCGYVTDRKNVEKDSE